MDTKKEANRPIEKQEKKQSMQPEIVFDDLEFLSMQQVAKTFQCTPRHLQREMQKGNLKGFKFANKLFFKKTDLQKWVLSKCIRQAR